MWKGDRTKGQGIARQLAKSPDKWNMANSSNHGSMKHMGRAETFGNCVLVMLITKFDFLGMIPLAEGTFRRERPPRRPVINSPSLVKKAFPTRCGCWNCTGEPRQWWDTGLLDAFKTKPELVCRCYANDSFSALAQGRLGERGWRTSRTGTRKTMPRYSSAPTDFSRYVDLDFAIRTKKRRSLLMKKVAKKNLPYRATVFLSESRLADLSADAV